MYICRKVKIMARKKNINQKDIYSFYMEYYLENGEGPKTAYQLAKQYNFNENSFYEFFGNIEAVEKSIFKSFFNQTLELLHKSDEYESFNSRNKLLTFYFTFFEILTANRSFVSSVLDRNNKNNRFLKTISSFKPEFLKFIKTLDIEQIDVKDNRLEKIMGKSLDESLWVQMILCVKFWLDDDSASLEKTDIFIEKSVNTGFDLLDVKPIKSILDLGKFLFHEKIHMN